MGEKAAHESGGHSVIPRYVSLKREEYRMASPLQVFEFENKKVRIVDVNGVPAFVAKDVVEGVGNIWSGITRIAHVPEEWRGVLLF
jgi:SH3-like domain-containing protein